MSSRPCLDERLGPDLHIVTPKSAREEIYRHHAVQYDELVNAEDHDGNLWPALRRLAGWDDAMVLEAGVGTGRVTRLYIDGVRQVTCCDRSLHMLEFARSALREHRDKIRFVEAENLDLPQLDDPVDVFIEGWSFGHAVSGCKSRAAVEEAAGLLVRNAAQNLAPDGAIILVETQGTNTDASGPPSPNLRTFYEMLEKEHGFSLELISTDYAFSSVDEAARVMGFFFGEAMGASVRKRGATIVPEWTGIWSKRI